MKAVRYHEYGDASVLRYEDAVRPEPGSGEVLVEVAATSFNPLDANIGAGYLQQVLPIKFPHTPGVDVAGTVAELGTGVSELAVGNRVIGFLPMDRDGAAAQFVVAPADVLVAAPSNIPLATAAALPAVALTAWQALFEHADLRAGQRIFINGAGGGVGGFAVQLAKQAGAVVIATASPPSAETVRAQGADQIVDYTSTKLTDAVTDPVDVVLNLVRAPEQDMADLVSLLGGTGVIVTSTSPADVDSVPGVRAVSMFVHPDAAALTAIVEKVDAGEVHVNLDSTYPLSDVATVYERNAVGDIRGKVVLIPEA